MDKIRLGKTGLKISRVAMGGIPIQRAGLQEGKRIINHAIDLGISLIDTSIAYGDSELIIGEAVHGRREDVMLATKGGWRSRETVSENIDKSMQRLETDYIDLWQMHNIRNTEAFEEIVSPGGSIEAAIKAKEEGKILHLGFSTHDLKVAFKGVSSGLFETVQFPFNFIAREAANGLIESALKHDVGFIGMKPFAGGNINDARLALGYVLQYGNVLPDPGIGKIEEVREIVSLVEKGIHLTKSDWSKINELRDALGNRFCRQCMYCMPCPQGVEIWLLTYMKNLFRLWPRENVIQRFGDAANTADKCIKCGECETRCPYGLPIRELIEENYRYYLDEINRA